MAWEPRGLHTYYYRSVREGTQVRKVYLGTGPLAALSAAEDAERQAQGQAQAAAWRQERATCEALDQQLEGWWALGTLLLKATLYAEGYYQHDRGEWRRRAPHDDAGVDPPGAEGLAGGYAGDARLAGSVTGASLVLGGVRECGQNGA